MKKALEVFNKYWYILIFLLIDFVIISNWFVNGQLLAGGEEGIPFYNAGRTFKLYSSVWYNTGTGYLIPVLIPRAPLFFVLQFFEPIFTSWISQALIFFSLVFSGFFSMYLLCKKLTENSIASFTASLFYFFNLYSTTQIWGRFLLTNIFAWAYLPLALFLWIKIIDEKKIKWIVLFLLSSLIFSYSYGMPAMLIVLWIQLFAYLFFKLFIIRHKTNEYKKIILVFTLTLVFWGILNSWWLVPYITLSGTSFSALSSAKSSLDSLAGVSQYFPNKDIFLLRQNFLLGEQSPWFYFYSDKAIYIGSIIIFITCLYGILSFRKNIFFPFLIATFIISWFLAKGTNPPFGTDFYSFLFNNFPFTTSLRNSYEKVGILFLLFYSVFFGVGLKNLYTKNLGKVLSACILIFSIYLVWPLWSGKIYENLAIDIPMDYQRANDFLNSKKDGRILMVPMIPGDGVQYVWPGGVYTGLEPSEFLFDKSSVSKILRSEYFDKAYLNLYEKFINGEDYNSILDSMNINYIILHNDLNHKVGGASSSAEVKSELNKNPYIRYINQFGKLDIYEHKSSGNDLFKAIGDDPPKLTYIKINATHYKVTIKEAKKNYKLLFKTTFNKLWEARISDKLISQNTIANGFENMWHIDKTGSYQIDITL